MRYQPRLANGQLVKLSWSLAMYSLANPVWPREEYLTNRERYMDRFWVFFALFCFLLQIESDSRYLLNHLNDIDEFFEGVPTALLQTEVIIRYSHVFQHRDELKSLLKRFYAEIYIPKELNQRIFARITRKLTGPRLITLFYVLTLLNYFQKTAVNIIAGRRELMYKQEYLFDHTKLPIYIILVSINYWVGVVIVAMVFGDLNMLGEFMIHLNSRYLELTADLQSATKRLMESEDKTNIAADYHQELIKVLRRNIDLNDFANNLEKHFTFRIFISFSISALLLCVLLFMSYKNPAKNIVFIFWFISKLIEQFSFGYLGSELYQTTDELDLMYFCGGWEQIISCSQNTQENVKLMKLIVLCIQLNSKPFSLTGLKYFSVTLSAVVKIVQGAFSYFTFINSMR